MTVAKTERKFQRAMSAAKRARTIAAQRKPALVKNQVVELSYRCRDIGYGIEQDTITAYWNGEIDTWGKRTIIPVDGSPKLYLFRDEILEVEP